jgi:hypothetical protein
VGIGCSVSAASSPESTPRVVDASTVRLLSLCLHCHNSTDGDLAVLLTEARDRLGPAVEDLWVAAHGVANEGVRVEMSPAARDNDLWLSLATWLRAHGHSPRPAPPPAGRQPGWYFDPFGETITRRWSGQRWEQHVAVGTESEDVGEFLLLLLYDSRIRGASDPDLQGILGWIIDSDDTARAAADLALRLTRQLLAAYPVFKNDDLVKVDILAALMSAPAEVMPPRLVQRWFQDGPGHADVDTLVAEHGARDVFADADVALIRALTATEAGHAFPWSVPWGDMFSMLLSGMGTSLRPGGLDRDALDEWGPDPRRAGWLRRWADTSPLDQRWTAQVRPSQKLLAAAARAAAADLSSAAEHQQPSLPVLIAAVEASALHKLTRRALLDLHPGLFDDRERRLADTALPVALDRITQAADRDAPPQPDTPAVFQDRGHEWPLMDADKFSESLRRLGVGAEPVSLDAFHRGDTTSEQTWLVALAALDRWLTSPEPAAVRAITFTDILVLTAGRYVRTWNWNTAVLPGPREDLDRYVGFFTTASEGIPRQLPDSHLHVSITHDSAGLVHLAFAGPEGDVLARSVIARGRNPAAELDAVHRCVAGWGGRNELGYRLVTEHDLPLIVSALIVSEHLTEQLIAALPNAGRLLAAACLLSD